MLYQLLSDASFHALLLQIDIDLGLHTQEDGCPYCQGVLDKADYPRSPFGLIAKQRDYYQSRISFCCRDCRRRVTPESVRFFGRRFYVAPVFMLLCLLQSGINERRLNQVKRHFGIHVSESTWKRWRRWWREKFLQTKFWEMKRHLVITQLPELASYPRALCQCFQGSFIDKFSQLLRFLSPLTGGVLRAV